MDGQPRAVANGVKKTMAELKSRFPPDLDYVFSLDTSRPVTEGLREIARRKELEDELAQIEQALANLPEGT